MNRPILQTILYQGGRIKNKTKEAEKIIEKALKKCSEYQNFVSHDDIKIEWNFKDIWYGGLAYCNKNKIVLNCKTFSVPYNERFFKDTILHELAHIIAYKIMIKYAYEYEYMELFSYKSKINFLNRILNYDHSDIWKNIAIKLGGTGDSCPNYRYYNWETKWECPICKKIMYVSRGQEKVLSNRGMCKNCEIKIHKESIGFYNDLENKFNEVVYD